MPAPTEQQLLANFSATRSEDAFERLVSLHIGMVLSCALRTTQDRGLAEEIAQNVFTVLARKASRLTAGAGLAGWLHKTTLYETKQALRGRSRRERKMKALAEHNQLEGKGATPVDDILPIVDEAIDGLPEGDRRLVILHFLEGRTFAEISKLLGKSEGACQRQASRAIGKLRNLLGHRGAIASVGALGTLLTASSVKAAPAALVASVATGAVAGASTLTNTSLLANAIQTMTYAKTKIAVLVAATAAVPIGIQFKANNDLKEDLRGYELRGIAFEEQSERLAQLEKVITELPGGAEAIAKLGPDGRWIGAGRSNTGSLATVAEKNSPPSALRGALSKPTGSRSGQKAIDEEQDPAAVAGLEAADDLLENPAMGELVKQQMQVQIEIEYRDLFDHLGLDEERREQVIALMLDQSLNAASDFESMDLSDPESMSKLVAESAARDASLRNLLGDEAFEVFESFEDSKAERQKLATFRVSLEAQGQELPFQLEQELMAIMHEERNRPGAVLADVSILEGELEQLQNGVVTPAAAAAIVATERELQGRILQRAAEFLTPQQLDLFRGNLENHIELIQNSHAELENEENE